MSILNNYNNLVKNNKISLDCDQQEIIKTLDNLTSNILENNNSSFIYLLNGYINNLRSYFNFKNPKKLKPKGLYLYSDVGRGKTMLMDLFFQNYNYLLVNNPKFTLKSDQTHGDTSSTIVRIHFHAFMQEIHKLLKQYSGYENPIKSIFKNNYKNLRVLCLDEFIVTDIADAMLLYKILDAIFSRNIYIITTSNIRPNDLYLNGLQRTSFLPAIDLINNNLIIQHLDGKQDYRASMLKSMSCYYYPCNAEHLDIINQIYQKLSDGFISENNANNEILILNRTINTVNYNSTVVWFDFNSICNTNRNTRDYLEIAQLYKTVIVSNIYQMSDKILHIVRRFINLIDILYDCHVTLIICANQELDNIYIGKALRFEFERTKSRIKEMQTQEYITKSHTS